MVFEKIFRGIWATDLKQNQELPVGGSIFSDELTTKLILDFDSFISKENLQKSKEKIATNYQINKDIYQSWLVKRDVCVDAQVYNLTNLVQKKTLDLLAVDTLKKVNTFERSQKINSGAKLSDMKGCAMCAEIAFLGAYMLQELLPEGYTANYMSGVQKELFLGDDVDFEDHSFIVINTPKNEQYIFDIAKSNCYYKFPRMLVPEEQLWAEKFQNTQHGVIKAVDVLTKQKALYGVSNEHLFS